MGGVGNRQATNEKNIPQENREPAPKRAGAEDGGPVVNGMALSLLSPSLPRRHTAPSPTLDRPIVVEPNAK